MPFMPYAAPRGRSRWQRPTWSQRTPGAGTATLEYRGGLPPCHAAHKRLLRCGDLHVLERAGSSGGTFPRVPCRAARLGACRRHRAGWQPGAQGAGVRPGVGQAPARRDFGGLGTGQEERAPSTTGLWATSISRLSGGRASLSRSTTPHTSPRLQSIRRPGLSHGLTASTWRRNRCTSRRTRTRWSPPDAASARAQRIRACRPGPTPAVQYCSATGSKFAVGTGKGETSAAVTWEGILGPPGQRTRKIQ